MKFILRYFFMIAFVALPLVSALSARARIITIYLHNCKNSSRMITAHVFNGDFNTKLAANRYTSVQYTWLSHQKNIGPGETVLAQCNGQGKRSCLVNAEGSDFSEVRRDEILYFYHHLKGDQGITKASTNPRVCGSNYKPATKPKPPVTT